VKEEKKTFVFLFDFFHDLNKKKKNPLKRHKNAMQMVQYRYPRSLNNAKLRNKKKERLHFVCCVFSFHDLNKSFNNKAI
jgi:hypothetical protein